VVVSDTAKNIKASPNTETKLYKPSETYHLVQKRDANQNYEKDPGATAPIRSKTFQILQKQLK